jgi:site-specific recombinase XerD
MNNENKILIDSFIEYITKLLNYTDATVKTCSCVCRRWARFLVSLNVASLKDAGAQHVLAWIDKRKNIDNVCDRTIESDLCILRNLHEYLISFHGPATDPCGCLPEFVCKHAPDQDYISIDEIFSMLDIFDTHDSIELRNYVIVALLWSTGLRNSELRALKWRDIDLQEATLFVRKAKGNIQRQLFLNDRVLGDLKTYRARILAGPDTHVFCTYPNSKRAGVCDVSLSNHHLTDILKSAARAAGIKRRVTAHMLRHSFATHMYESGVDIADIAQMMGHAHRTETTRYIHVTVAAAQRLLNAHVYHTHHYREDE